MLFCFYKKLELTSRKSPLNESYQLLATVLALIIGISFTVLGIAILTNIVVIPDDEGPMMRIFGGLLVLYGIFRLIRVYLKFKSNRANQNESNK